MPSELDHLFIMVSLGAPEADRLVATGLSEGQPNLHPGQGTSCRRFFFANAYLELLWVECQEEAQSELARPLRMWERWSARSCGSCPFGVILRPTAAGGQAAPFATWEYRPPYLPPSLVLQVGVNSEDISEPLLVHIPIRRRPDSLPAPNQPPLEHGTGFRELTALRVFGPWPGAASGVMRAAEETGSLAFHRGDLYYAEIGFDGEHQGHRIDLRPLLPLVLCS